MKYLENGIILLSLKIGKLFFLYSLDIFYNEYIKPITQITEIPIDKLPLLIDNAGIIIQRLKTKKDYILDISSIKAFIDDCTTELYSNLLSLNLI